MKKYYRVIWTIFFIQLIVIAVVLKTAKVDDMTVAKGRVRSFNTGWVLVREDGVNTDIDNLPYNTSSRPNEKVIMKNIVWSHTGKCQKYQSLKEMLQFSISSNKKHLILF